MSPLFLLSVSISGFLTFSKDSKWTKSSWDLFRIWELMIASIPYAYSDNLTQALKVMQLYFHFRSACPEWTVIIKYKNFLITFGLLLVGCLCWFYFLLRYKFLCPLIKILLIRHINFVISVVEELFQTIYAWLFTVAPM